MARARADSWQEASLPVHTVSGTPHTHTHTYTHTYIHTHSLIHTLTHTHKHTHTNKHGVCWSVLKVIDCVDVLTYLLTITFTRLSVCYHN